MQETNLARDERFFVFASTQLQSKKLMIEEKDDESSKWKSSIIGRDSDTEDAFSSSSRRSCPKWESYTLFQKYDEEMAILDRISAQKHHETGNHPFSNSLCIIVSVDYFVTHWQTNFQSH